MRAVLVQVGLVAALISGCDSGTPSAEPTTPPTQGRPEATIEFDCSSGRMVSGVLDYTEDETGQTGSPAEVVRKWLGDSLRPSDELIPVEPDDSAEAVTVVRNGDTIGVVALNPAPGGDGLVIHEYDGCQDSLTFP